MAVVLAGRVALAPPALPRMAPARLVALGVVAYAAFFSFVSVARHATFRTHALDLGQYAQNMWHLARGVQPVDTILGWHVWGNHLSLVFYPLAPLTLVLPGPWHLLVLQSVALALGAVPLFLLARRRVGEGWAAAVALLYLLNPSLHGVNVRDFHPNALAVPLLLTAMYAAEARRVALLWLAVLATLTLREDAAIAVVGLALWLALAHRRWTLAGALGAVALGWLFVAIDVIMPAFREDRAYPYITAHYRHLGDSLGQVLLAPVLRPRAVVATVLTLSRLRYLLALLAPFAFLPVLAPLVASGALPAIAENVLSDYPVLLNHRSQYQVFILPFLAVAAVAGLERLQRGRLPRALRRPGLTPRRALAVAALASVVLSASAANDLAPASWRLAPWHRAAYRLLARIPDGATVSAADRFFPHLYDRTDVHLFPRALERADWAILEAGVRGLRGPMQVEAERAGDAITFRVADGPAPRTVTMRVAADDTGVLLLRRPGD